MSRKLPHTVVLCDDHEIVREAIKARTARYRSIKIVGEAGDGEQVIKVVKRLRPDVVIIDVELPERDGIEATKVIREQFPGTKVVIFTAHAQPDLLALAMKAGATGYVLKSSAAEEIANAVEAVVAGKRYIQGDYEDGGSTEVDRLLQLTPRERQILVMLSDGMRIKEIALRLGLSGATVHTHVRNAIGKLDVETRTEAVALAVRFSYLGLEVLAPPED